MNEFTERGVEILEQMEPVSKRPWQLILTGDRSKHVSAAAARSLTRILELFPGTSHLILETESGSVYVGRDFPSAYSDAVDQAVSRIFDNAPGVTGITFPAGNGRLEHTATREDPHWSPKGKAAAAVHAAVRNHEMSADEAVALLEKLYCPPAD